MKFPMLGDIATKEIVSIDQEGRISEAIELILEYEHRNIVVTAPDQNYILSVLDILALKAQGFDLQKRVKEIPLTPIPSMQRSKNVLDTLAYVSEGIEYICVINSENRLYGLISHTDIINNIDPDTLMNNYRLQDYLRLGKRMKWIGKEEITFKLLHDMVQGTYDNAIIVEKMKPIGIITTKDLMMLIKRDADLSKSVENYMSSPVESVSKEISVKEALEFLKKRRYKRLVVVDEEGKLAGIVSQKRACIAYLFALGCLDERVSRGAQ